MKKFLEPKQCYNDPEPELTFKVDIENLKFMTGVTILSSNQNAKFYSDFFQGHKVPGNDIFFCQDLAQN